MKKMIGIVLFMIMSCSYQSVEALSCINDASYTEKYAYADKVFKGKLLSHGLEKYTFQIDYTFKGDLPEKFTFYDAIPAWLDEQVEDGKTYLVFARSEHKNYITISPCGDIGEWSSFLFFLMAKVFMWVFAVFILLNVVRAWKEGEIGSFLKKHSKNAKWLIGIIVFVIAMLTWPL